MSAATGAVVAPTIADRLRQAGGVMVQRNGHAVAAHFGSTATELAVCVKRVGLAVRSDLDVLEITGPEPWLSHFLSDALGQPAPDAGHAARIADTWCCRAAADRALVVGAWSAVGRWTRFVREAIVTGSPIACDDRSQTATALTLVGPRVARLLADVGLDHRLAPDAVREDWFAAGPATLLREGADRYLLVVDAEQADEACETLLEAGRALGLAMVGTDALQRLAAAIGRA